MSNSLAFVGIGAGRGSHGAIPVICRNKTTPVPERGSLSTYNHTTSHFVLNSDGYYQEIPVNGFASRGARITRNLLADTTNWNSALHVSSETLGGWTAQNSATINGNTFNLAAQSGSLITSRDYGSSLSMSTRLPTIGYLVKLSGPEGAQVRLGMTQVSTYIASYQIITLSTTPRWYWMTRQFTAGADTALTFRIREHNAVAVSNITMHAWMPVDLTCCTDKTSPREYVSYGVGIGDELIPSTTFSNWTDATVPDGWSYAIGSDVDSYVVNANPGLRVVDSGDEKAKIRRTNVLRVGEPYVIEYEYSAKVAGSGINIVLGTINKQINGAVGVRSFVTGVADGTTLDIKRNSGSTDCTLSYLSIKSLSHGAMSDGLKVFETALANTVDANGVVTFAEGALLPNIWGGQLPPGRSNIATQYNDFTQWADNSGTPVITGNQKIDRTGKLTIAKIANTGAGAAQGKSKGVTLASSTTYTISFTVYEGNSLSSRTGIYNSTTALWEVFMDLVFTGGVPARVGGTDTGFAYEAINNGGFIVSYRFTTTANAGAESLVLHCHPDRNNTSKFVYAGEFQVEAGYYATPIIPTAAGTASITAATHAISWITGLVNNFKITAKVRFKLSALVDQAILGVGDASSGYCVLQLMSTGKLRWRNYISGISYDVFSDSALLSDTEYTIEMIYKNGMTLKINGVAQADTDSISANMSWADPELLYLGALYTGTNTGLIYINSGFVERI